MTPGGPSRAPRATAAVAAIALNTFREAIRDRVLYLLLVFALILITLSRLLSLMTVGDEDKIIKDVGLSALSIFGMLTAVFVGVSLVFKEIERRTVYTLLASPVRRWQFVGGKFVGLLAVLLLMVSLMGAALVAVLVIRGQSPWSLLPALPLIVVELAIVTAFALLFSSLTNPILAAVATLAVWVMGQLAWSLQLLKLRLPAGWSRGMCEVAYWLLPHLDRLNVRAEVVHGIELAPARLFYSFAYGCGYVIVVLCLTCWVFERKDFN